MFCFVNCLIIAMCGLRYNPFLRLHRINYVITTLHGRRDWIERGTIVVSMEGKEIKEANEILKKLIIVLHVLKYKSILKRHICSKISKTIILLKRRQQHSTWIILMNDERKLTDFSLWGTSTSFNVFLSTNVVKNLLVREKTYPTLSVIDIRHLLISSIR